MSIYFHFLSTESDETLSKWRWHNVKKVGMTPCPRSGISSVGVPGTNKVLFFGGVQDVEENDALDVNINFTVSRNYFNFTDFLVKRHDHISIYRKRFFLHMSVLIIKTDFFFSSHLSG